MDKRQVPIKVTSVGKFHDSCVTMVLFFPEKGGQTIYYAVVWSQICIRERGICVCVCVCVCALSFTHL